MNRRNFIRLLGGGAVLAAAGGGAYVYADQTLFRVPASAVAAWRTAGEGGQGQAGDVRRFALSYAILAPNPHNRQPWMADLSVDGVIVVSLDPQRLLPQTDPFGRQIVIGFGAFLELLVMAAAQRGYRAEIALFPDGEPGTHLDGRPMARVTLLADPAAVHDPLFAQILQRRTDRRTYDPARPATAAEIAQIGTAVDTDAVAFGVVTQPAQLAVVREITKRAWFNELSTPATMMESQRLLRIGGPEIDQHRDGISLTDPMIVALAQTGLFDRSVPLSPTSPNFTAQIDEFSALAASTPGYLWLVTEGNSRAQQVAVGRAYVRANLAATRLGLAMHPNSQALQEFAQVATEFGQIHQALGAPAPGHTVQMLARLGRLPVGSEPVPPSPRRGLAAQIVGV